MGLNDLPSAKPPPPAPWTPPLPKRLDAVDLTSAVREAHEVVIAAQIPEELEKIAYGHVLGLLIKEARGCA